MKPVLFFEYKGVQVFHQHQAGLGKGDITTYWFSTSAYDDFTHYCYGFDLRDYGVPEFNYHPDMVTGGMVKTLTTRLGFQAQYVQGGILHESRAEDILNYDSSVFAGEWLDQYRLIQMATIKRLIDQGLINAPEIDETKAYSRHCQTEKIARISTGRYLATYRDPYSRESYLIKLIHEGGRWFGRSVHTNQDIFSGWSWASLKAAKTHFNVA